ncbi:hypothetical protein Tco_1358366, partial [Tanacetum coccineum]
LKDVVHIKYHQDGHFQLVNVELSRKLEWQQIMRIIGSHIQSMLQNVTSLDLSNVCGVPRQLVIEKDPSSPDYLFLLLRMVDKSHELSLAYDVVTMKMKKTNAGVHSPIAIRHILPLGA